MCGVNALLWWKSLIPSTVHVCDTVMFLYQFSWSTYERRAFLGFSLRNGNEEIDGGEEVLLVFARLTLCNIQVSPILVWEQNFRLVHFFSLGYRYISEVDTEDHLIIRKCSYSLNILQKKSQLNNWIIKTYHTY